MLHYFYKIRNNNDYLLFGSGVVIFLPEIRREMYSFLMGAKQDCQQKHLVFQCIPKIILLSQPKHLVLGTAAIENRSLPKYFSEKAKGIFSKQSARKQDVCM